MPRPDDAASGGRGRRSVTAARRKPNVFAQLVTWRVAEPWLDPNIPAKLRLIAPAAADGDVEARAQSKALPAEPDAYSAAATLPGAIRFADAIARKHLSAGRLDSQLFGNQLVPERGLHAESAGDIPLLRRHFIDARADVDGHGPVQRNCVDQRENHRIGVIA